MENEKDIQKQEFEKKMEELRQATIERDNKVQDLHSRFQKQVEMGSFYSG